MKIRLILLISMFLTATELHSAAQEIRLAACIDSAMSNRGSMLAALKNEEIAALQTAGAYAAYRPQISLSYNYRYNALTPAQVIPVGEFSPVPTDETRAIRFGTDWQQNAGISLYQPVLDPSIRSRIAESRINERISNADAGIAEQELKSEVILSYLSVLLKQEQLNASVLDTLSASSSLALIRARYDEGRISKVDLNRAVQNHNGALSSYRTVLAELIKEKMYLGYLTGIPVQVLIDGRYDLSVWENNENMELIRQPDYDSIPEIRQLVSSADLVAQQQRTERRSALPVLGLEAFLGANQYSNDFDPFRSDQWYGSSYVGIALKIPLVSGENTRNKVGQLKLQEAALQYRIEERKEFADNASMLLSEDIRKIEYQLSLSARNIELAEENITLFRERLSRGQATGYDLILQEVDLQQHRSAYNELRTELLRNQVEWFKNAGALDQLIRKFQ